MRRRIRSFTILEMLLVGVTTILVGAAAFALVSRAWQNHQALLVQNQVQREARAAVDLACNAIGIIDWTKSGYSAIAISDPTRSVIGWRNGFKVRMSPNVPNRLEVLSLQTKKVVGSVGGISRFQVNFATRDISNDGSVVSGLITDLDNDTSPGVNQSDPRIARVVAAVITVTASQKSYYGVTYTSTLTSTVKIRNQFYMIAP